MNGKIHERIDPEAETEGQETEKRKQEVKRLFDSFKPLGFSFIYNLSKEIKIEEQEGASQQILQFDPEQKAVLVYPEFFKREPNEKERLVTHLLAEFIVAQKVIDLEQEGCPELENMDFEAGWLKELTKPEGMPEQDWAKKLKQKRLIERLVSFLLSDGTPLDMAKQRLKAMKEETQKKLTKNEEQMKRFLEETERFFEFFSQAFEQSSNADYDKAEEEAEERERQMLSDEERETGLAEEGAREGEEESRQSIIIQEQERGKEYGLTKEHGLIDKLLKPLEECWKELKGEGGEEQKPKEKKEAKKKKLSIGPLGKLLMKILLFVQQQKALQEKMYQICMDWALQSKMKNNHEKEDAGEPLDPGAKRVAVLFNKIAYEESGGFVRSTLESGVGQILNIDSFLPGWDKIAKGQELTVLDIMERLERARKTQNEEEVNQTINQIAQKLSSFIIDEKEAQELKNHPIYHYWKKTLHEGDLRDIAGGVAALCLKCARIDEGVKAWEWLLTCNLLLWKLAPRKDKPDDVPQLQFGLQGSHNYSSVTEFVKFMLNLAQTPKWQRKLKELLEQSERGRGRETTEGVEGTTEGVEGTEEVTEEMEEGLEEEEEELEE